jgi:hypothetical protein
MTKKELLARATELGIVGRHDMNVTQLQEAIAAVTKAETAISGDQSVVEAREALIELKRRTPSTNERDETGRVVRRGRNLSMNTPFRPKFYYLDPAYSDEDTWSEGYREAVNAAPGQVRLILKSMRVRGVTSSETAEQGRTIVQSAIEGGFLSTKIPPANLYAFYRRLLKGLGVVEA